MDHQEAEGLHLAVTVIQCKCVSNINELVLEYLYKHLFLLDDLLMMSRLLSVENIFVFLAEVEQFLKKLMHKFPL